MSGNQSYELIHQGTSTGYITGNITNYYRNDIIPIEKTFDIDIDTEDGDSGGPYYRVTNTTWGDMAHIAGTHVGEVSKYFGTYEAAYATYIGSIEDQFNLMV